jgi:protein TonB
MKIATPPPNAEQRNRKFRYGAERLRFPPPVVAARPAVAPYRALLAALGVHLAILAGLAAWRLPLPARTAAGPAFAHTQFTFLPPATEPAGGGTPDAGGGGTGQLAAPSAMPPLPPAPPMADIISIPATKFGPLPHDAWLIANPCPTNWVIALNGSGTGAGDGVGDGSGSGLAGTGTGDGTGDGNGTGVGYVRSPQPKYPPMARQQGWEGTALLRVEVSERGTATTVQVIQSTGHQVLDDAAVKAVRLAKFIAPARPAWVEIPISFRLSRS